MSTRSRPSAATAVKTVAAFAVVAVAGAIALSACHADTSIRTRAVGPTTTRTPAPTSPESNPTTVSHGVSVGALHTLIEQFKTKYPKDTVTSAAAVRTDRSRLLALEGDPDDSTAQGVPVVVLQIRGRFATKYPHWIVTKQHGTDRPMPERAYSPRTATLITETLSVDLKHVLDAATQYPGNQVVDMEKLGPPVVEVPVD